MHQSYKKCISDNEQCTFGQTVITIAAVNVWQCGFYVRQPYRQLMGTQAHLVCLQILPPLLLRTQYFAPFSGQEILQLQLQLQLPACLPCHSLFVENAAQSIINYTPCCTRVPECRSPSIVCNIFISDKSPLPIFHFKLPGCLATLNNRIKISFVIVLAFGWPTQKLQIFNSTRKSSPFQLISYVRAVCRD